MRRSSRFFILCSLFAVAACSQAWIDTGHMIVATIAQSQLKPKVKAECDRLLAIGADEKNADFVTTSPWADDIRGQRRETGPWHYIDLHFRSDGKPTTNKPDAENVVWAIDKFSAILRDRTKPDAERSEALRFLIHFVGDIHQPLHATARDTDAHPEGDKGGNDFRIVAPAVFNGMSRPPRNLHSFWDFGGGLFRGERRPLTAESKARIDTLSAELMKKYPPKSFRAVNDLNPMHWAEESLEYDKTVVYNLTEGSTPSDAYVKTAQDVSAHRITLAGYRLARLLNDLLK